MITKHTIPANASILDAIRALNTLPGGSMTLFVLDNGRKVTGTLTDGDIRRAIIAGMPLEGRVGDAARHRFRSVTAGAIDPADLRKFRNEGITMIPVLDSDGHLADILDLSGRRTRLPLKAVLMAGGKGERLRPMTEKTPKPLLQIEGKAIIDYNIEALAACGIDTIFVTTRYLAEMIENHFDRPVAGVKVQCVCEDAPCGTIGSVALTGVAKGEGDTLVMNSDLLTTISFEDMYLHHRDIGADITVAVVPYQVSVPFAVLAIDPDNPAMFTGIEEKPSYSYYANAGIYIFSNKILRRLRKGVKCDATELIDYAIRQGAKASYFPIKGTWIDVGSPLDFRQAAELMKHHKSLSC